MTITRTPHLKTAKTDDEPITYEINGPAATAWSVGCLAITLLACAAILAVLALPIIGVLKLVHLL